MVLTWRHIIEAFIIIVYIRQVSSIRMAPASIAQDWRDIEALAEQHPYLVGLLSGTKDYICTGSIISQRAVLTSGSCVASNPKFVAITAAMYNRKINNRTVFEVAYTKIHDDYVFDVKATDPNVTRMHSNIGLVLVKRPHLAVFVLAADLGIYYASELKDKKMLAVGYGRLDPSEMVAIQSQEYHQTPCTNPRWYYCVCGIEYSTYSKTYTYEFGTGAPVLLGHEIVGIAGTPCGTLSMRNLGIKYNIFTVIGPYQKWIEKSQIYDSKVTLTHAISSATDLLQMLLLKPFCLLIMISKALL